MRLAQGAASHCLSRVGRPAQSRRAGLRARPDALFARLRRARSEEHTSELQSQSNLVCRLLLEKKKIAIWVEYDFIPLVDRQIDTILYLLSYAWSLCSDLTILLPPACADFT